MSEFVPGPSAGGPDCVDRVAYGAPSALDQYITKQFIMAEDDYPADACPTRYYSRAKIDDFEITNHLTGKTATFSGAVTASSVTCGGTKCFNIPHPSTDKEGMRLVHACLEGPENGVYFRGRVKNREEISYPSYWKDLVDWTTVTVNLTPIGAHQNVIIKRLDEDKIYLQSKGGMPIDCFYHVYGTRKDIALLPVEMQKDEPWPYS